MDIFTFVVLPLLIFLSRIVDVSLGTFRIILISKGYKYLAPVIGFFEVLIWLLAISRVMKNLDNWVCFIAYAGGFATGNLIGMILEEKIALGYELIRVITKVEATALIQQLKEQGYGITSVKAMEIMGEVDILYIIVKRTRVKETVEIIRTFNPNAIYTIEDIRFVNRDVFHKHKTNGRKRK